MAFFTMPEMTMMSRFNEKHLAMSGRGERGRKGGGVTRWSARAFLATDTQNEQLIAQIATFPRGGRTSRRTAE